MKAKLVTVAALVLCSIAMLAQAPPAQRPANTFVPRDTSHQYYIVADRVEQQGSLTHFRGNVQIKTETLTITADALDYNVNTREADLRGSVRAKMLPETARIASPTK